jgi:hypothetical protein
MARKAPFLYEPPTHSLSNKRLDPLAEYGVMDGVKNARGGFLKYRTRTGR